jgi:hypothetical protein
MPPEAKAKLQSQLASLHGQQPAQQPPQPGQQASQPGGGAAAGGVPAGIDPLAWAKYKRNYASGRTHLSPQQAQAYWQQNYAGNQAKQQSMASTWQQAANPSTRDNMAMLHGMASSGLDNAGPGGPNVAAKPPQQPQPQQVAVNKRAADLSGALDHGREAAEQIARQPSVPGAASHILGGALGGGLMGATGGGLHALMSPGHDEYGRKRSRLKAVLEDMLGYGSVGALGGGGLMAGAEGVKALTRGGGSGHGVSFKAAADLRGAVKKIFVRRLAKQARDSYRDRFCSYLDKLAHDLPPLHDGLRVAQIALRRGADVGQAMAAGFPKLARDKRVKLTQLLVKQACYPGCKSAPRKTYHGKPHTGMFKEAINWEPALELLSKLRGKMDGAGKYLREGFEGLHPHHQLALGAGTGLGLGTLLGKLGLGQSQAIPQAPGAGSAPALMDAGQQWGSS